MERLTLVIIDDEPKGRDALKNYINLLYPNNTFEIILCNSVKDGVHAINTYHPDLVFLDIEMPEVSGFELFKQVKKDSFEVVFVTAYSQFMEQSVNEYGCFGYLHKPIEGDKLNRVIERYFELPDSKKYLKFVTGTQNKRVLINLEEVLYCKAENNYTTIYLSNQSFLIAKTLKQLEEKLPTHLFTRIHRSYLVNMQKIAIYDKEKNVLIMQGEKGAHDYQIPVSSTNKEKLDLFIL